LVAIGLALLVLLGDQAALYLFSEGNSGFGQPWFSPRFVILWAVEGGLFLYATYMTRSALPRWAVAVVLAFSVLLRVAPLMSHNFLTSDLYRYVWDGRLQNLGINPYCCVPADPELTVLRDDAIYAHINRKEYAPTIYPPAAQMLFAAVAAVSQSELGVKAAMALCDAISIICMVILLGRAGLPRSRVLIFAWHPLVLWEYVGNGHVDAAATAWLALAMVAATSARAWVRALGAGFALAGATLTKFLPIVVAPAFWRRDWRLPAAFIVSVVAAYACYGSVGWKVLGFLSGYSQEEGLESGAGIYWLRLLSQLVELPSWTGKAWLALTAIVLAVIALVVTLRRPRSNSPDVIGAHAIVLATALIVMLTPHYAWYYGWLAFLACLAPLSSVLWLTVACVAFDMPTDHPLVYQSLIFLPFVVLAALDVARQRRRA
jgi:hypothetical protein